MNLEEMREFTKPGSNGYFKKEYPEEYPKWLEVLQSLKALDIAEEKDGFYKIPSRYVSATREEIQNLIKKLKAANVDFSDRETNYLTIDFWKDPIDFKTHRIFVYVKEETKN